jgi:GNAT superfamily N-acetyltransferase
MTTLRELRSLDDPLLFPWLDLYETAFPPGQRGLATDLLRCVRKPDPSIFVGAAVDAEGAFEGMCAWKLLPEMACGYVWYLAVPEGKRGRGIAGAMCREIVARIKAAGMEGVIFEVECPDLLEPPEGRAFARARLEFYKRLGALLLEGVEYQQTSALYDPVPSRIMYLPFGERPAPGDVFAKAKLLFGDDAEQAGELGFS